MRVALAMSGGVDSSVAGVLLREQGHEVVGFTLKVWEQSRCCSLEDVTDARRVAAALDLPFYVLDARDVFEREVIDPFVEEYRSGRTPNPCVWCNRRVKFAWLLQRARALGCDAVATGHYARLEGPPGARILRKGVDPGKDQSYFLVPERPAVLDRLLFPVGGLSKAQVRALAAAHGLPVAAKSDSQDVCFVPEGDLAGFFHGRLPDTPGDIVDRGGRVLGRHPGIHRFTVGQRKGLGLAARQPLYVLAKDPKSNRLVVGPRSEAFAAGLEAGGSVWLAQFPPVEALHCAVKLRSTGREVPCAVERSGDRVRVRFRAPQFGVAPGQMAVFYDGDVVLGGAWIEATWAEGDG